MYFVRVKDSFCAAHLLTFHDGSVEPLHGHNWFVEAVVACPTLDATGLGVNFCEVHRELHDLLDAELDHKNLGHIEGLGAPNPTSEMLAKWIADRLAPSIGKIRSDARLHAVTVWETEQFGVTYELDTPLKNQKKG